MGHRHPNSLKQLKPFTRESAIQGQKNSVIARKANKERREALKAMMKDYKAEGQELLKDIPDALTVLRLSMAKALEIDDSEEATRLATILAEFESPKLQRQDITQVTSTSDLSDEELEAALKELGINKPK